jgi:UDP-N-acetylmuramoylalanine--D-glutamate ligase
MNTLRDAPVLVLGLGDSGLAMARWCAGQGAAVRVWDSREDPPQAAALARDVPGARLFSGPLDGSSLDGAQRVFKSPGLAPHDARIAGLLQAAARAGVPVQGELDLFAQALAALKDAHGYAPKVLAITGTNGKTTTTAMTALLVERCGLRVAMAGNIGPTMLDTLAAALALEVFAAPRGEGGGARGRCLGVDTARRRAWRGRVRGVDRRRPVQCGGGASPRHGGRRARRTARTASHE